VEFAFVKFIRIVKIVKFEVEVKVGGKIRVRFVVRFKEACK